MISLNPKKILLYWNTLRYVRLSQIFDRFKKYFFIKPVIKLKYQTELRKKTGKWHRPALKASKMTGVDEFCFLNRTHCIRTSQDWNNTSWSKLWLYNLHYFDDRS